MGKQLAAIGRRSFIKLIGSAGLAAAMLPFALKALSPASNVEPASLYPGPLKPWNEQDMAQAGSWAG